MGSNRKLLFGVLFVVAALVLGGLLIARRPGAAPVAVTTPTPAIQTVAVNTGGQVAYAAQDIPAFSIVTKEMLEMRKLPGGGPSTAFVTNPDAQAVGYITRVAIPRNALIRPEGDFVGHISETGIAGALRPGTRAMVIPFANKPTLHDLVRIGNFIDVNASFDGQEARTLVSGIRVLAVDVFGNDYPQVNVAVRGPYKADPKGNGISSSPAAPGAPGAPGVPSATPTPTPAPAQPPARPDPALTLEVTPAQANTILLAQTGGGTLDFVVRPALPGGRDAEAILVDDATGATGGAAVPGATPGPSGFRSVSVTRAQIAPYAERKKAAGGGGGATRTASTAGGSGTSGNRPSRIRSIDRFDPPIPIGSGPVMGGQVGPVNPRNFPEPTGPVPPPAQSPTYEIPIYADGKTVRVETVRRPQE